MTTVALTPTPRQLFLNPSNGAPAAGFKVFTYQAGTTTKQTTYVDSTGTTPNVNPIILDSLGEADIWLDITKSYKIVFANPNDTDPPTNPIWTRDNINISGGSTLAAGFPGLIGGLTLSAAGSVGIFGIATGSAADSTGAFTMKLSAAYTKTTGPWAVGSGNGALDVGTIANNTWYNVFEIARIDTNVVDILLSLSVNNPTLPPNYSIFRRIGSMLTDGSSHWVQFIQNGNTFLWSVSVYDIKGVTPPTGSRTLYPLTVPTGVNVTALFRAFFAGQGPGVELLFTSPLESDQAPSTTGAGFSLYDPIGILSLGSAGTAGNFGIITDTSARIGARASGTATGGLVANTYGWIDLRGSL